MHMSGHVIKLSAVAVITIGLALGAGFFMHEILAGSTSSLQADSGQSGANFLWGAVFLIVFFAAFALQSAAIENRWLAFGLIAFETAALAGFSFEFFGPVLAVAMAVACLALYVGHCKARASFEGDLKIRFSFAAEVALHWAGRGLALLFAALTALVFLRADEARAKKLLGAAAETVPGFDVRQSLREATGNIVGKVLSGEIKQLPPAAQEEIVGEASRRIAGIAGDLAGSRVKTSATVLDVLYNAIAGFLGRLSTPIKTALIAAGGLLLYFTFKSILSVAAWVSAILGSLVFKLLVATRFVKIKVEPRDKEIVSL